MNWNLFGCALRGHESYEPDESELASRLRAQTAGPVAWRCLRCGAFVTDGQHSRGPAAEAPLIRRGKELRSELILRAFAVERFLRFLVLAAAAFGVWRFRYDKAGIQRTYNDALPVIRDLYRGLGFDVTHSKLLGLIQQSFTLNPRTLLYLAMGLAAYAAIELLEAIGLWLGKRWGEYFALVATSVFVPYEIYDLTVKITWLRVGAFTVNLLLIAYLVRTKRRRGARGANRAFDALWRTESGSDIPPAARAGASAPTELAAPIDQPIDQPGETAPPRTLRVFVGGFEEFPGHDAHGDVTRLDGVGGEGGGHRVNLDKGREFRLGPDDLPLLAEPLPDPQHGARTTRPELFKLRFPGGSALFGVRRRHGGSG